MNIKKKFIDIKKGDSNESPFLCLIISIANLFFR